MVHNHSPAMGLMHVPSYKWGINNTIGTNMYIHMYINICIYICIYIYMYTYIYYGFVTCDWYMIMVRKYSNFLTVTKTTPAGHRQDPHKPRLEANGASEVSWFAGKFRRLSGKSPIGCWFIWSQSTVCLCVFFQKSKKRLLQGWIRTCERGHLSAHPTVFFHNRSGETRWFHWTSTEKHQLKPWYLKYNHKLYSYL